MDTTGQRHDDNGLFSRERLAGYESDTMRNAVVAVIGCGAGGNNIAMNLALSGVGELRFVDYDVIESSNLTRSPLFRRDCLAHGAKRHKAREVALGALSLSYAAEPRIRYAMSRAEQLGLGALHGVSAIMSAVDSLASRAFLADAARLLGIPLIEAGFSGNRGQVTVFPNRSAEEPCWRCLHPGVETHSVSCGTYAANVVAEGRIPATQPLAAAFSALMSAACLEAIHGRFPLGGRIFHLDITTGKSSTAEITADPACPGVHRVFPDIQPIDVRADDPLSRILEAVGSRMKEPVVRLPMPFIVEAPCARCGSRVSVMRPAFAVREAPACKACHKTPDDAPALLLMVDSIGKGSRLRNVRCRKLGLPMAAIFEVEDAASGESHAYQLQGSVDDLYTTLKRKAGNGIDARCIEGSEATDMAANKE